MVWRGFVLVAGELRRGRWQAILHVRIVVL
jgi:hypothetical protein